MDPQFWTVVYILVSLGGAPLTLAQGLANLDIPRCNRFPLHGERTCGEGRRGGQSINGNKTWTSREITKDNPFAASPGSSPFQTLHFSPGVLELGGRGRVEEKLPVSHAETTFHAECRGFWLGPNCWHFALPIRQTTTGSAAVSRQPRRHTVWAENTLWERVSAPFLDLALSLPSSLNFPALLSDWLTVCAGFLWNSLQGFSSKELTPY